jgi:seryl-tRNA synthetase
LYLSNAEQFGKSLKNPYHLHESCTQHALRRLRGELQVPGQSGLNSETWSPKQKNFSYAEKIRNNPNFQQ